MDKEEENKPATAIEVYVAVLIALWAAGLIF